jgi:hypothetical protein
VQHHLAEPCSAGRATTGVSLRTVPTCGPSVKPHLKSLAPSPSGRWPRGGALLAGMAPPLPSHRRKKKLDDGAVALARATTAALAQPAGPTFRPCLSRAPCARPRQVTVARAQDMGAASLALTASPLPDGGARHRPCTTAPRQGSPPPRAPRDGFMDHLGRGSDT